MLSNPDPADVRMRWSRHLMFNLSRPERSLILLAPLAHDAGGYEICSTPAAVFADTNGPDYQAILNLCRAGQQHLEQIKRFDMPGFRPPAMYVREMQRFGIVPQTIDEHTPLDVYATDEAYWRSLWWQPVRARAVEAPDVATTASTNPGTP